MRILAILSLAMVAGSPAYAAPDEEWGRVVQNNVHAQLVDPDPQYARVLIEGGAGRLGSRAWSRYQSDNVKPLLPLSGTSALGRQTGGNSGGGSSGGNNSSGSGSN
jgi:uncharacterized membrane protein YgcG